MNKIKSRDIKAFEEDGNIIYKYKDTYFQQTKTSGWVFKVGYEKYEDYEYWVGEASYLSPEEGENEIETYTAKTLTRIGCTEKISRVLSKKLIINHLEKELNETQTQ